MIGVDKEVKCLNCGLEFNVDWGCTEIYNIGDSKATYLPFTCRKCGSEHLTLESEALVIYDDSYESKVAWFETHYGKDRDVDYMNKIISNLEDKFIVNKLNTVLLSEAEGVKKVGSCCF